MGNHAGITSGNLNRASLSNHLNEVTHPQQTGQLAKPGLDTLAREPSVFQAARQHTTDQYPPVL
jgi:hypothetical protein